MKWNRSRSSSGGAEVLEQNIAHVTQLAAPWPYEVRMVLPNDVILNGNFYRDASWTKHASWTISSGAAHFSDVLGFGDLSQTTDPLTSGQKYRVRYDILNASATMNVVAVCGTAQGTIRNADGTYEEDITANGAGFKFTTTDDQVPVAHNFDLDNVSASVMPDDTSLRMHLRRVFAGYDRTGATAGSGLTIEWTKNGTVHTFRWYPPSSGQASVTLPRGGIYADPDTLIILKLDGGAGAVVGKINAFWNWESHG